VSGSIILELKTVYRIGVPRGARFDSADSEFRSQVIYVHDHSDEVSVEDDRMQADIYGRAGIPVYWIINLIDRQVEVYSNPGPSGYQSLEVFVPPHVLTVMIDGVEVGEVPVAEILP
jgi:hypothetical protein